MNKINYSDINSQLADKAWELYTTSFPIDEQRPYLQHKKAMSDSRFYPYVYTSDESELLAICFYWDFIDFKYLEHFAVNPNYRNQGIGSEIIKTFRRTKQPVILEIDPPVDSVSKQRLRFYERCQFRQTNYTFQQLKYRKDSNDVLLKLLCNKKLNSDLFEKFKHVVYQELAIYCE